MHDCSKPRYSENCIGKASLKEEENSIGLARRNQKFQMQNKIATDFLWVQASNNYYNASICYLCESVPFITVYFTKSYTCFEEDKNMCS